MKVIMLRQAQQNWDEAIPAVKSKFSSGQGYPPLLRPPGMLPSFDLGKEVSRAAVIATRGPKYSVTFAGFCF
jgi:hypothetical protein